MPKSPRGSKARAVRSVKRAQKTIRKYDKQKGMLLTPTEIRNAFHKGYSTKDISVKFKKRSAKKK